MRKLLILMAVFGLVAASCGGDSDANSCEGVADEFIEIFQEVIDELDSLSLDALDGDEPPAIADLEQRSLDLEAKADGLGCTEAEMEELVAARAGNLKSDGLLGQFLISEAESGGFFGE